MKIVICILWSSFRAKFATLFYGKEKRVKSNTFQHRVRIFSIPEIQRFWKIHYNIATLRENWTDFYSNCVQYFFLFFDERAHIKALSKCLEKKSPHPLHFDRSQNAEKIPKCKFRLGLSCENSSFFWVKFEAFCVPIRYGFKKWSNSELFCVPIRYESKKFTFDARAHLFPWIEIERK